MHNNILLNISAWLSGYWAPVLNPFKHLQPSDLFCSIVNNSPSAQRLLKHAKALSSWAEFLQSSFISFDHLLHIHQAILHYLKKLADADHPAYLSANTAIIASAHASLQAFYNTQRHLMQPPKPLKTPYATPPSSHNIPFQSPQPHALSQSPQKKTHAITPSAGIKLPSWHQLPLWKLLGIKPPAGSPLQSVDLVKSTYRKKIQQIHPDRNPHPRAAYQTQQLTNAYTQYIRLVRQCSGTALS